MQPAGDYRGLAGQRRAADDGAERQAGGAAVGGGDGHRVIGGGGVGYDDVAQHMDEEPVVGVGDISVPRPIFAQRAFQGEDGAFKFAVVVGYWRRDAALILSIVGGAVGIVIVVEV
jgi:hypothetical protein